LVLLFHFLAIDDVDAALEQTTLNTYSPEFLNEGSLADTIASANLNILCFSLAVKLLEDFSELLPFAIDTRNRGILELYIDIVCLSEAG
jgi:hypothetical protein